VLLADSLDSPLSSKAIVLTIGVFDGVHLGHQRLITTAIERAASLGCASAVITFDPHPNAVIQPDNPLPLLTSIEERSKLIEALGADILVVAPFNRDVMSTPAVDYMRQIKHALPLQELWIGYDFALGRRREGNFSRLTEIGHELGYTVGTVARVLIGDQPISSTRVRETLQAGQVAEIVPLLGRFYGLEGTIVQGHQRGRTIGFPTANFSIPENHMLPADGVYACMVSVGDRRYKAVTNIGNRPTFDGIKRSVEAHLLDFEGDLYGKRLGLEFIDRIRDEQRFAGIEALIAQIGKDVETGRALFARHNM
jgi:riboflavin kinase/FMN adenylyltransferase